MLQLKNIPVIRLKLKTFSPDWRLLAELFNFGLPISFLYIFITASGFVVQYAINLQGSIFVAGFTATNKIYGILECSAISLGVAIATFCSQNYGAGNMQRFRQGVWHGFLLTEAMALLVTVFALVFGKYLLQMFIDPATPFGAAALQVSDLYLFVSAIFLFLLFPIHTYRNGL